jgi:thiamine-monophosphate kinase
MNDDDQIRRPRAIEIRTPRDSRFFPHTALGPGAEFDAVRRMLERWGPRARKVGDDAAVINAVGDQHIIASTDMSVEGVHFRRDWMTPQEIGYRAAAAALSDLAAMGSSPLGMLVAMGIPEEWRRDIDGLADGIGDAVQGSDTPVIGGDMSYSPQLALTITVLGTARHPLVRSGARAGDNVYVTGRFGGPGAALHEMLAGRDPAPVYRERFVHPVPRIKEGIWLADHGATSAIDISDGLSSDLRHLAAASKVSMRIDLGSIPVLDGIRAVDSVASGEEYELAVSGGEIDTAAFAREFGLELTRVGAVEKGDPGVGFFQDGEPVEVPSGYLHFT